MGLSQLDRCSTGLAQADDTLLRLLLRQYKIRTVLGHDHGLAKWTCEDVSFDLLSSDHDVK